MNKKQRLILAIFIPIIILFIALMIANNLGYTETTKKLPENSFFSKYFGGTFTFNQRAILLIGIKLGMYGFLLYSFVVFLNTNYL